MPLFEDGEMELLQVFRAELLDEMTQLSDAEAKRFSDVRLVRFLRGKDGNIQIAAAEFRRMLKLRADLGLPELLKNFTGKAFLAESVPGLPRVFKLFGIDGSSYNSRGNMIWVERLGCVDLQEVSQMSDDELMVPLNSMLELRQEHFDRLSLEKRKLVKADVMYDLSGLSVKKVLGHISALSKFKAVLGNWMRGYPESADRIIVLDPPRGFHTLFDMISTILSEKTRNKICFMSGDLYKELAAAIGPESLEALARVRCRLPMEGTVDISAGRTEGSQIYRTLPLAQGETVEWAFKVGPDGTDISLTVLFFQPARYSEQYESEYCSDVFGPELVKDAVAGCFTAEEPGFLWVTLSNYHSWVHWKQVRNIRFTVTAASPRQQMSNSVAPVARQRSAVTLKRQSSAINFSLVVVFILLGICIHALRFGFPDFF